VVLYHLLHKDFLNQQSKGNFLPVKFMDSTSTDYWNGKFFPVKFIDRTFYKSNSFSENTDNGNLQYEYIVADNDDSKIIWHRLALQYRYQPSRPDSDEEGEMIELFCPSLHSLFLFSTVPHFKYSQLYFIRVLAVFGAHIRFSEEDIACWLDGLINLRYLGFIVCWIKGGSLGVKLGRLRNLQTLDLSESFVLGLSAFLKKNTKVNVVGTFKDELPEYWSPMPDLF
jgi:hypothetical protein